MEELRGGEYSLPPVFIKRGFGGFVPRTKRRPDGRSAVDAALVGPATIRPSGSGKADGGDVARDCNGAKEVQMRGSGTHAGIAWWAATAGSYLQV